jgi:hypothetical protein
MFCSFLLYKSNNCIFHMWIWILKHIFIGQMTIFGGEISLNRLSLQCKCTPNHKNTELYWFFISFSLYFLYIIDMKFIYEYIYRPNKRTVTYYGLQWHLPWILLIWYTSRTQMTPKKSDFTLIHAHLPNKYVF